MDADDMMAEGLVWCMTPRLNSTYHVIDIKAMESEAICGVQVNGYFEHRPSNTQNDCVKCKRIIKKWGIPRDLVGIECYESNWKEST
jgi:hypothetical protein